MPREKATNTTDQPTLVRLPRAWHDALRRRSFEERVSMASLIRAALAEVYGYEDPDAGKAAGPE